jgi:hypothetical protein
MSTIQQVMPTWRLRQVDHVAVAADPDRAYDTIRGFDLYRVPVARALFGLRVLPERLAAWLRREPAPLPRTSTIAQVTAPGTGFHLLSDEPREIVVGSIGRFWKPSIEFADISPATFSAFDHRGWGKLAWSIAVSPRDDGGSWITFDLRVDAGDDVSWARFQRYWLLIGPFSHALRRGLLAAFARELGEAPRDDERHLPGDELRPHARLQLTHAIDIEAPPGRVWPWLLQMGGQRAGWYSWDRLDNGGKPSADHIIPELQHLEPGQIIPAAPVGPDGFEVLEVHPGRALILGSKTDLFEGTWAFVLEPIGADATRLITRYRAEYDMGVRMAALRSVMPSVHAIMEWKQLRTLKARAESATDARIPARTLAHTLLHPRA